MCVFGTLLFYRFFKVVVKSFQDVASNVSFCKFNTQLLLFCATCINTGTFSTAFSPNELFKGNVRKSFLYCFSGSPSLNFCTLFQNFNERTKNLH